MYIVQLLINKYIDGDMWHGALVHKSNPKRKRYYGHAFEVFFKKCDPLYYYVLLF